MTCPTGQHPLSATPIRLLLLGRWDLRDGETSIKVSANGQRLLALLALRGGLRRERVWGTLWPDTTDQFASGRLRTSLWRLGDQRQYLLHESGGMLELCPAVDVDVHRMEAEADLGDLVGRRSFDRDLLIDWDDGWLDIDREQVRQTRLHALESLATRLTGAGRYLDAVLTGLQALNDAPLRESAHRAVIAAHLAEGNFAEARAQYERCRRALRRELNIEPTWHLSSLMPPQIRDAG